MHPLEICRRLGSERITRICDELNSNQLKATLRKGGINPKATARVVSQKAKRKLWSDRVHRSLDQENGDLAESLLYEWLLNHRRAMLVEYLDAVGVKHKGGETEDSFTKTVPAETLRAEALRIARARDPMEVAAYVLFLDHHQESDVYSSNGAILKLMSGGSSAAPDEPAADGDTQRGDSATEDSAMEDTAGGDTARGDAAGGDTARGDTVKGDTARGDTAKGDTARGNAAKAAAGGDPKASTAKIGNTEASNAKGDTVEASNAKGGTVEASNAKGGTAGAKTGKGGTAAARTGSPDLEDADKEPA